MQQAPEETSRSLVSQAIGAITQHMRAHDLGPGDRLPSESQLSREMGVSRTVVREAFRSLAAMRLIELSAGKRAVIAELDYGVMSPVIEHGVQTEQISIQQIYDVRRTIEMRTAALASLRRSEDESARILAHTEGMRANFENLPALMEHDLAFHLEIAKAARNPVFTLIVGAFDGVTRQTWPIGWRSRSRVEDQLAMIDLHRELAEAIAAGDPARAQDLMAKHFDRSVKALVDAGMA
ncbi:FadR/GntR family transcriptional regulator [Arvimicrobium flavum]|uniref:FadR/GntR family transcriptional regulator n=1 Tax=Arvimicrobium flavum TaxID=3393320 RepID=UPI00237A464C|nr:FadR/GntR family transcriptional regulator [Mesorhizobium shangrilense]